MYSILAKPDCSEALIASIMVVTAEVSVGVPAMGEAGAVIPSLGLGLRGMHIGVKVVKKEIGRKKTAATI